MAEPAFVARCPLCSHETLEVSSWDRLICRHCNYFGSALSLYRKLQGVTFEVAIKDLSDRGAIDCRGEDPLEIAERTKMADQRAALQVEWGQRFLRAPTSGRAILQQYGITFSDREVALLAPHVGIVTAADLQEISDPPMKAMGRYSWLAIACTDEAVIHGHWLVGLKDIFYIPCEHWVGTRPNPVGWGLVGRSTDKLILQVPCPVAVLRLQMRHLQDQDCLGPIVCPVAYPQSPRWMGQQLPQVFWPSRSPHRIVDALRTYGASVLGTQFLDSHAPEVDPLPISSLALLERASREAMTPARALVRHCLAIPETEARNYLLNAKLTEPEREECLLACENEESDQLSRLFGHTREQRRVDWGQKTIEETDQGWLMGRKVISQVIIRAERILPDGAGDARVFGFVRYRQHRIPFDEALSTLRKNAGAWAHALVLRRCGASPVIDPGYSRRLFDIAQLFHEPRSQDTSVAAGWSTGTGEQMLRFPLFAIDRTGLHPGSFEVVGPPLPVPGRLTPQEFEALSDRGFCELLLAVVGNLVLTAHGSAPLGLVVQNRGFLVERFGEALGLRCAARYDAIAPRGQGCTPLPIPCALDESDQRQLFRTSDRPHVLTSVGAATYACLGLSGNWLRLGAGSPPDYRALRFALLGLPAVLRANPTPGSVTFYRDIAEALKGAALVNPPRGRLHEMGASLDQSGATRISQVAPRLLALVRQAERAGALQCPQTPEGPQIRWEAVQAAYSASAAPLPGGADAQEILQDAGYLVGTQGSLWTIREDLWGSLAAAI